MLDITTSNQQANISYCGYGVADDLDLAAGLLDEDVMGPLFDEDWLHENNLDILFDLFEEEIESKVGVDSSSGSSALFGTSPVTSYLFGTSPSLASTLDLLYLDNQQQASNNGATVQQQQQPFPSSANVAVVASSVGSTSVISNSTNSNKSTSTFNANGSKLSAHGAAQQAATSQRAGASGPSNSVTNAIRIKRGLKRGQSEGMSLLAKPMPASNKGRDNNSGASSRSSSSKLDGTSSKFIGKHNSDKTSAKITNFKNSIIIGSTNINSSNRNGIDINYSKQSQQQHQQRQAKREKVYLHNCQHHIHQITGRAVIREHAYAVRGH